jgi:membrane protease YdiL (CAAX protease family)
VGTSGSDDMTNQEYRNSGGSQWEGLRGYFLLVFGLALPFFWLGGNSKLPLPINLPVSALVTVVPATAASILVYRRSRAQGINALFKKALDYQKIKNKLWYLPALLLAPLIYVLSYIIMRLADVPLPDRSEIPLNTVPAAFMMFLIADAGEELGWTGFAIDPMQNRWGALKASLLLGGVWALWHAIPFVQTGNSASWVVWQSLKTIATRVMIIWIYNKSGKSVFAATLYHAADNVSWSLFPNNGSHYNPMITALINWIAVVVVAFGWGARSIAQFRSGKRAE